MLNGNCRKRLRRSKMGIRYSQPQYPVGVDTSVLFALNSAVFVDAANNGSLAKFGSIPTTVSILGLCLNSNTNGQYVTATPKSPVFKNDFVLSYHYKQTGAVINGGTILQLPATSGNNNKIDIYSLNTGVVRVDWYSSGGTVATCDTAAIVADGSSYKLELVCANNVLQWYNNGVKIGSPVGMGGNTRNGESSSFNLFGTTTTHNNNEVALFAVRTGNSQVTGDNPWQILQRQSRILRASAGGAAALAGNTSNQATSSAALIISTALASSTASQSTISAALTIINALASSASSQAGSSPALSIGTQLAASTSNAAASTAQLSVPVPLATNASNQALSSATLAYPGAVALSTSVSNNASSSASISIATQLQSQVVAQPSSAAVMSLPVALFANTQSIGIATPALSLQISLSSSTANQSSSSATLTSAPVSALSSVTSNQAISSAMLSLAVALNANTKSNAFSLATITIGSPAPPSPHTENVWRMRARGTVFRMRERSTVWRARE